MFRRLSPHPEPTRFSTIRKMRQRSRLRREGKQPEDDHEK
jgi:hypothetical protein